jgi:hypothetical protein
MAARKPKSGDANINPSTPVAEQAAILRRERASVYRLFVDEVFPE